MNVRMDKVKKYLDGEALKPEVEWCADGTILLTMCIPAEKRVPRRRPWRSASGWVWITPR